MQVDAIGNKNKLTQFDAFFTGKIYKIFQAESLKSNFDIKY